MVNEGRLQEFNCRFSLLCMECIGTDVAYDVSSFCNFCKGNKAAVFVTFPEECMG